MNKRKRQLKGNWLKTYMDDYIIKQESPDQYHFWTAMQMIATALKRNVYIDRGAYTVYPNQFVFLVANSGKCRKSIAMKIGMELVSKIDNINLINGRSTVEGLIDSMAAEGIIGGTRVGKDGSCLIYADELSYLFGKASYITDLISFLTAAYTGSSKIDFLTRGKGKVEVRNPAPGILAGTTPQQMGDIFPSLTLYSGFMARALLIYGTAAQSQRIAKPLLNRDIEDLLIHDLGCISELSGPCNLNDEAELFFENWYENMPDPKRIELEAFHERKHDHVLKLALGLSVAESDNLFITTEHLVEAIEYIEKIESTVPAALSIIGATAQSGVRDLILRVIKSVYPESIQHSNALRRVYKKLTNGSVEFNIYIQELVDDERIIMSQRGGTIYYTVKEEEKV